MFQHDGQTVYELVDFRQGGNKNGGIQPPYQYAGSVRDWTMNGMPPIVLKATGYTIDADELYDFDTFWDAQGTLYAPGGVQGGRYLHGDDGFWQSGIFWKVLWTPRAAPAGVAPPTPFNGAGTGTGTGGGMVQVWVRIGPGAGPNGSDVFLQGNHVIYGGKVYQVVREENGGAVILVRPGEVPSPQQQGPRPGAGSVSAPAPVQGPGSISVSSQGAPPPPPATAPYQVPGQGDAGVGASGTAYSTAEPAYPPGDPRNQGPPILTGNNNAPPVPADRGPAGGPGSYGGYNTGIVPPHLRGGLAWRLDPNIGYELYATVAGYGVPLNIAEGAAAIAPGLVQFGLLGGTPGDEARGFHLSGPTGAVAQLGAEMGVAPETYQLPAFVGARIFDLSGGHTVLLDGAHAARLLIR